MFFEQNELFITKLNFKVHLSLCSLQLTLLSLQTIVLLALAMDVMGIDPSLPDTKSNEALYNVLCSHRRLQLKHLDQALNQQGDDQLRGNSAQGSTAPSTPANEPIA